MKDGGRVAIVFSLDQMVRVGTQALDRVLVAVGMNDKCISFIIVSHPAFLKSKIIIKIMMQNF